METKRPSEAFPSGSQTRLTGDERLDCTHESGHRRKGGSPKTCHILLKDSETKENSHEKTGSQSLYTHPSRCLLNGLCRCASCPGASIFLLQSCLCSYHLCRGVCRSHSTLCSSHQSTSQQT